MWKVTDNIKDWGLESKSLKTHLPSYFSYCDQKVYLWLLNPVHPSCNAELIWAYCNHDRLRVLSRLRCAKYAAISSSNLLEFCACGHQKGVWRFGRKCPIY